MLTWQGGDSIQTLIPTNAVNQIEHSHLENMQNKTIALTYSRLTQTHLQETPRSSIGSCRMFSAFAPKPA